MLNVTIICLGKLKEKYLREACEEYAKRLSAFCKLNIVELTPEKLSDNPSEKEIENALSIEAKKITDKIPKGSYIYSLCIEGKQISSFGLSDTIKKMSSKKLSMSKMTFPHQLARVMLLEQIYRAVQISAGTKYHK